MKTGVLVLAAGRTAGGPETYEVELLRALAAIDTENEYVIYCPEPAAQEAIRINQGNFSFQLLRPRLRAASLSFCLPYLLRRDRIDVFHATYAPPPVPPKRMVFTCHGLATFLYPGFFPWFTRWRLNYLQRVALRHASKILCVSEFTLKQLQTEMNISSERLELTRHGVDSTFQPHAKDCALRTVEQRYGIDGPYLLYVGKVQELKNIRHLLSAFDCFRKRTAPHAKLVLAGKVVDGTTARLVAAQSSHVITLGHVNRDALPPLYQAAEMLVFPSLFESFGLPVVEAMSCGVPVISSRAGALPEVCGEAAVLVDPQSVEAIGTAMSDVYTSPDLRARLIAQGLQRAKLYCWKQTALATLAVYRDVLEQQPALARAC